MVQGYMPIIFLRVYDGEEFVVMQLRQELVNGAGVIVFLAYTLVEVFRVKVKSELFLALGSFSDVTHN